MKHLFLADLKDMSEKEIKEYISSAYAGKVSGYDYGDPSEEEMEQLLKELKDYNILIAYESVGSWGCDSSSWFLLKHKKTGKLYENHGGHNSCFGFEGQWTPEETTLDYLKSDKFYLSTGGYDDDEDENERKVKGFLKEL